MWNVKVANIFKAVLFVFKKFCAYLILDEESLITLNKSVVLIRCIAIFFLISTEI